jgi:hypothetical protein
MDTFGLRINEGVCFSTPKKAVHEKTRKRQLQIVKPFVPLLKQFMEPDEEILLALRGCSPMTTLESITMGVFVYHVKRCVLVVTNKRILHFPARGNHAPRQSIAEVRYGDIANVKLSAFLGRVITITYAGGGKERFYRLQPKEFKKLKALVGTFPKGGQPTPARGRQHLCPKCMSPLAARRYACPACRLEFKNRTRAIRMVLLIPGGGYFYAKHPGLALLYAVGEAALLVALIVLLVQIGSGNADEGDWAALVLVAVLLAIEKALSVYHVQHFVDEYIPADEDFVPIKSYAR